MKIITNNDINDLIVFSKHSLGVYKLVYKKVKGVYWFLVFSTLSSILFLLLYFLFIFKGELVLREKCFWISLIFSFLSLILAKKINRLTKVERSEIQNERLKLLKKYYFNKKMKNEDIKIINEQLKHRIDKTQREKITILLIWGVLILPIWENLVQFALSEITLLRLIKIFFVSIIISFIILIIIKIYNLSSSVYEENIYLKNNKYIIENIIYLNTYIIKDREQRKRYGRGK